MREKIKNNLLKYIIIFIVVIIGIVVFTMYYNLCPLISYVENDIPAGEMVWNTAVTVDIKVLNNGTLLYGYGNEKGKLEKEDLQELKQLVAQLKEKVKGLEENRTASYRFTINFKTYAIGSLDSEGQKIISQIKEIIY